MDGDFGDAFRAGAMVAASHGGFPAEGSDGGANAVIVGGDEDAGDAAGLARAFDNVLDHGLASNRRQRFAREAGRIVASRDDSDNFRVFWHGCFQTAGNLIMLPRRKLRGTIRRVIARLQGEDSEHKVGAQRAQQGTCIVKTGW